MTQRFLASTEQNGWTHVWIADEHGCFLHTEPVCSVPKAHDWFVNWLVEQPCEYPDAAPLLWHPMLGETLETHLAKEQSQ